MMASSVPFYRYSSFNKRGGKAHPLVARRMERILDMWASITPTVEIARQLNIAERTVREYLRRARKRGDPRATRPEGVDRQLLYARTKRRHIQLLNNLDFSKPQIAMKLDCSLRLVQIVLKEAA